MALCRELGIADRLVSTLPPRTAFVLRSGRLVTLPEASFLGLPTRLGSLVSTKLFSWPAKLRMALELVRPARRDEDDESIGQFMRRRFGGEAVSYLAEPLLAGIHAGDVERLSLPALFPRLVEAERSHGSVLRTLFASRRPPSTQRRLRLVPRRTGRCHRVTRRVAGDRDDSLRRAGRTDRRPRPVHDRADDRRAPRRAIGHRGDAGVGGRSPAAIDRRSDCVAMRRDLAMPRRPRSSSVCGATRSGTPCKGPGSSFRASKGAR